MRKKVPGALESHDVPRSHTYFALQQGNLGAKLYLRHFPPSNPSMEMCLILSTSELFSL